MTSTPENKGVEARKPLRVSTDSYFSAIDPFVDSNYDIYFIPTV